MDLKVTGTKIVTPLFTGIAILSVQQMNSKNDRFIIDHSGRNYFPQIDQNFDQTQTTVFDSMPTKLSNRYRYFFKFIQQKQLTVTLRVQSQQPETGLGLGL